MPILALFLTLAASEPAPLAHPVALAVRKAGEGVLIAVADGDAVKTFDGELRPGFTIGGLAGPRGVAFDKDGRLYVADTGSDRVLRFTADGKPDLAFGVRGALRGPIHHPFERPSAIAIHGEPGDAEQLLIVDRGGARLVRCLAQGKDPWGTVQAKSPCQPEPYDPERRSVSAIAPGRSLSHPDAFADGDRVRTGRTTLGAVRGGLASMSYLEANEDFLAGLGRDGELVVWYAGERPRAPVLHQKLPFPATAIARHPLRLAGFRMNKLPYSLGPVGVWVAGPGRLELLTLPELAPPLIDLPFSAPGEKAEAPAPLGDLARDGVLVEQPLPGTTVRGRTAAVMGRFDRSRYSGVVVKSERGLAQTVSVDAEGRFVAPEVPIEQADSGAELVLLHGEGPAQQEDELRLEWAFHGADREREAVRVVAPESGAAPFRAKLRAEPLGGSSACEWDFDGDGVFETRSPGEVEHTFVAAGRPSFAVRCRVPWGWAYTTGSLTVLPGETKAREVKLEKPRALGITPPTNPQKDPRPRHLLVTDRDLVQVFDADLSPLASLGGLSSPGAAAGDGEGRIYVADSGHDRIVRFGANFAPDPSFGTGGALAVADGVPFKRPSSVAVSYAWGVMPRFRSGLGEPDLWIVDTGNDRLVRCGRKEAAPWSCHAIAAPDPRLRGLRSAARSTSPSSVLFEPGGLPLLVAAGAGLFAVAANGMVWELEVSPKSPPVSFSAQLSPDGLVSGSCVTADGAGRAVEWSTMGGKVLAYRPIERKWPVGAVLIDHDGSEALKIPPVQGWAGSSSAHVVYLAGPGHLERIELAPLTPPEKR